MLTALLAPRKSRTAKPLVEEIGMFIAIEGKWRKYLECCAFLGRKGYSRQEIGKNTSGDKIKGDVKLCENSSLGYV